MVCTPSGCPLSGGCSQWGAAGGERTQKLNLCSQVRMDVVLSAVLTCPAFPELEMQGWSSPISFRQPGLQPRQRCRTIHEETPQAWLFSNTNQFWASATARLCQKGGWESRAVRCSSLKPVVETALHMMLALQRKPIHVWKRCGWGILAFSFSKAADWHLCWL